MVAQSCLATVVVDSVQLRVRAVHEIPASSGETHPVLAAVPANIHAFAYPPFFCAETQLVYHSGHLVSENARIRNAWRDAFHCDELAATDAPRHLAESHMSGIGLRNSSSTISRTAPPFGARTALVFCAELSNRISPTICKCARIWRLQGMRLNRERFNRQNLERWSRFRMWGPPSPLRAASRLARYFPQRIPSFLLWVEDLWRSLRSHAPNPAVFRSGQTKAP